MQTCTHVHQLSLTHTHGHTYTHKHIFRQSKLLCQYLSDTIIWFQSHLSVELPFISDYVVYCCHTQKTVSGSNMHICKCSMHVQTHLQHSCSLACLGPLISNNHIMFTFQISRNAALLQIHSGPHTHTPTFIHTHQQTPTRTHSWLSASFNHTKLTFQIKNTHCKTSV